MFKYVFLVLVLVVFAGTGCIESTDNATENTANTSGGIITDGINNGGAVETSVTVTPDDEAAE